MGLAVFFFRIRYKLLWSRMGVQSGKTQKEKMMKRRALPLAVSGEIGKVWKRHENLSHLVKHPQAITCGEIINILHLFLTLKKLHVGLGYRVRIGETQKLVSI